MRIAFLIPSLRIAGPVNVVKVLTDELLQENIDITVFYFDNKQGVRFNCPTKKISFTGYAHLQSFDIIHSHGFRPDLFVFLFKSKFKSKVISTIHSYIKADLKNQKGSIYSHLFTFIWNLILTRHDKIVLLSKHMRDYYASYFFNKKLDYAYNAAVLNSAQSTLSNDEEALLKKINEKYILLGSICYISRLKGLHQIITLLSINTNLAFVVIGDGLYRKALEDYAKQLNVFDRCYFLGFKEEPYHWLQFIRIYVAPSYTEGFPIAVLEAGLCKKAIVCSNLPIYKEIFVNNEIKVFENDNLESLSMAVNTIAANVEAYGERVFNTIQSTYLPINTKNKYLLIYKKVLNMNNKKI